MFIHSISHSFVYIVCRYVLLVHMFKKPQKTLSNDINTPLSRHPPGKVPVRVLQQGEGVPQLRHAHAAAVLRDARAARVQRGRQGT